MPSILNLPTSKAEDDWWYEKEHFGDEAREAINTMPGVWNPRSSLGRNAQGGYALLKPEQMQQAMYTPFGDLAGKALSGGFGGGSGGGLLSGLLSSAGLSQEQITQLLDLFKQFAGGQGLELLRGISNMGTGAVSQPTMTPQERADMQWGRPLGHDPSIGPGGAMPSGFGMQTNAPAGFLELLRNTGGPSGGGGF